MAHRAHAVEGTDSRAILEMPAPPEEAARDIDRLGVEGRPADSRSGPGLLRLEVIAAAALVLLVSIGFGWALGWGFGLAALAMMSLSLLANPVLRATAMRARDRERAAVQELQRDKDAMEGRVERG